MLKGTRLRSCWKLSTVGCDGIQAGGTSKTCKRSLKAVESIQRNGSAMKRKNRITTPCTSIWGSKRPGDGRRHARLRTSCAVVVAMSPVPFCSVLLSMVEHPAVAELDLKERDHSYD